VRQPSGELGMKSMEKSMAGTEKFWVAIFWGGMSVFNSTQLKFLLYPRLAMVKKRNETW